MMSGRGFSTGNHIAAGIKQHTVSKGASGIQTKLAGISCISAQVDISSFSKGGAITAKSQLN